MAEPGRDYWRRCNGCKGPIDYGVTYYTCSVSTCNRKRTGLRFCSVSCWEIHLPVARHREAWADEQRAPTRAEAERAAEVERAAEAERARPATAPQASRPPKRILPRSTAPTRPAADARPAAPKEVLVVASRLKDYVRATTGFNTSDRVLGPLSDILREVADRAVRNAERDERKTVLARDVPRIRIDD